MALKTCYECGKQVSDIAKICPNCGANKPTKTKESPIISTIKKILGLICIGIIFYIGYIILCSYFEKKENQKFYMQKEVRSWINNNKDVIEYKLSCKSVKLIKESSNKYTGYAIFDNGDQANVEVTIEGDEYLMKAELAQVISKKILSYTDSNNKLQFQDENVEYEERKQVSEKEYLDESLLLRGKIIQHISENVLLVKIVEFPLNIFGTEAENVAVTFPKDCEELQKADNEKMFIRAVRDNLYSYTDIFGAKTTVKKYRYIESKNIFDVEIEGVNELEMYQLCNYLLELN